MFALLIKPVAMRKPKYRQIILQLKNNGAYQVTGHDVQSIRAEIEMLSKDHQDITLVACGGDGTVNLGLNSIIDLPVKLAVLPMGTGNDFARHVGLKHLERALATLNDGFSEIIDVGQITFPDGVRKYYAAVASCGFDALVNERANKISGPDGPLKYLASVFGELKDLAPTKLTLRFNDQKLTGRFTLIAVGNTSSYGGGMKITPSADLKDGLFALTIVDQANRKTLVKVLPTVFSGRHVHHPKVSVEQTSTIEITGERYPIYADGERMGFGPATFSVLPNHIQLLVPKTNNV